MLRTIFYICGFYKLTIVQKGDLKQEKDAPIYIFAPHTSLFDVLAGVAFNAPSSVAKADIVDIPFFGSMSFLRAFLGFLTLSSLTLFLFSFVQTSSSSQIPFL